MSLKTDWWMELVLTLLLVYVLLIWCVWKLGRIARDHEERDWL